MGYAAIESALVARFLAHFPDELEADRVTAGDPDGVMDAIFSQGKTYGVVLEYGGGREDNMQPFSKPVWFWTIMGVFFIRYDENVEANLRMIVDKLSTLLDDDKRLAGSCALAKFDLIGDAEPGTVNDTPFYWLPFTISAVKH